MITMQQYAGIRRRYTRHESLRGIARCLGLSRNTVRKYCRGAAMPEHGRHRHRNPAPETLRLQEFARACMAHDEHEQAGKQKHTARRVHERAMAEIGYTGSYATACKVWRRLMNEHGSGRRGLLRLEHEAGVQMQVDFAQVWVHLNAVKTMIHLFIAVLPCSGRFIAFAYRAKDRIAFLDGVYRALQYFGGVPQAVVFDNDSVAVRQGTGAQAVAHEQYAALAAHCCFKTVFCNAAAGHEKGCVERMVRYVREHAMVSVPHVSGMEQVDELLRECAAAYDRQCARGWSISRLQRFAQEELPALHPLPQARFETALSQEAAVSSQGLVTCKTCSYSVPLAYAGRSVTLKVHPACVEIYSNERGDWDELGRQKLLARHPRLFGRHESSQYLQHVLRQLLECPRALLSCAALRQALSREERAQLLSCGNAQELRERLRHYARRQLERTMPRGTITTIRPGHAQPAADSGGAQSASACPAAEDGEQRHAQRETLQCYTDLYARQDAHVQESRHAGAS